MHRYPWRGRFHWEGCNHDGGCAGAAAACSALAALHGGGGGGEPPSDLVPQGGFVSAPCICNARFECGFGPAAAAVKCGSGSTALHGDDDPDVATAGFAAGFASAAHAAAGVAGHTAAWPPTSLRAARVASTSYMANNTACRAGGGPKLGWLAAASARKTVIGTNEPREVALLAS